MIKLNEPQEEAKSYEVALYEFKANVIHYLKTGVGSPAQLLQFLETYQENIKQEKQHIDYLLYGIFPPNQDMNMPQKYKKINVDILKHSLDMFSLLFRIIPKKKDHIFQFLCTQNFNFYEKSFESSLIFRSEKSLIGLDNAIVGLQSILEFQKKEKFVLSDQSAERLMHCVIGQMKNNFYLVDEDNTDISPAERLEARTSMSKLLYLYAFEVLVREPGAIESFQTLLKQKFDVDNLYMEETEVAIEKAKMNFFTPNRITSKKEKPGFKI